MIDKKVQGKNDNASPSLKFKSYSIDEILNAGGTTAFANKLGKNPANISLLLKRLPKDSFLSDEEAEKALELLNEDK